LPATAITDTPTSLGSPAPGSDTLQIHPLKVLAAPPGLVYICAAEARVRASSVQTEEVLGDP